MVETAKHSAFWHRKLFNLVRMNSEVPTLFSAVCGSVNTKSFVPYEFYLLVYLPRAVYFAENFFKSPYAYEGHSQKERYTFQGFRIRNRWCYIDFTTVRRVARYTRQIKSLKINIYEPCIPGDIENGLHSPLLRSTGKKWKKNEPL